MVFPYICSIGGGVCAGSLFGGVVLSVVSSFAITLLRKGRADCFTSIVILLSFGCLCFVSLPNSTLSWSMVCDCGISWAYSIFKG